MKFTEELVPKPEQYTLPASDIYRTNYDRIFKKVVTEPKDSKEETP